MWRMNVALFGYFFSDRCNLFCKKRGILSQLSVLEMFIFQTEMLLVGTEAPTAALSKYHKIPDDSIRKKGKGSEKYFPDMLPCLQIHA